MANTYTYNIKHLETTSVGGLSGVVAVVHYQIHVTDEAGNTATFSNCVGLEEPTDTNTFIPFDSLLPEQVLEWALARAGDDQTAFDKQMVDRRLELKLRSTNTNRLPWAG